VEAHGLGLLGSRADVDLAGDGGGDEGGAAFLEEVDGALGFGGEFKPDDGNANPDKTRR
jgi:hypothetical protein